MKDVKNKILEFNKERDWDKFHSPENLAKSIVIEAGELLECFQWNGNYNHKEVCNELADIVNYCILLSNKLNVELEDIVLEKLEITRKKYPLDKSKGVSTKYTEFSESE